MHWNVIFCVCSMDHNCLKWMKNALDAEIFVLHDLWCFNPVDPIHLFPWEKIAPFGCGVMARL